MERERLSFGNETIAGRLEAAGMPVARVRQGFSTTREPAGPPGGGRLNGVCGDKERGFTLLELLLAVAIFSIAAIALYSTFHGGIEVLRRTQSAVGINQELRIAMNELETDLHNCLLSPLHGEAGRTAIETANDSMPPAGEGPENKKEPVYYFFGRPDSFTFVTLKDGYTAGGSRTRNLCDITYAFERAGGRGKLMRTLKYQNRGFTPLPGGGAELLSDIDGMEVFYSYAPEEEEGEPVWLDKWEEEETVPLGVQIKFTLKAGRDLKEFKKTVYIPVGKLGEQEGFERP